MIKVIFICQVAFICDVKFAQFRDIKLIKVGGIKWNAMTVS